MATRALSLALAAGLASLASVAAAAAGDRPVLQFDFYRAMQSSAIGAYAIQNFNLASVAGASKYVHTEVIAEHIMSDPERTERKYGIDTVARLRFKVKNPSAVLASPPAGKATQVDFGPFVTFDSGVATNYMSHPWIQQYGSYVGVQQQTDVRWPYTEPYFWFSVTGWCPTLRYDRVPITRREAALQEGARRHVCEKATNRTACSIYSAECAFEEGTCLARDPAPTCLNLTANSGASGHVLGGLCRGGEGNLSVEPTGALDCTYSYDYISQLSLDKVAGISGEDCGGRLCTDWLDFRKHCSNPAYRRKFDVATAAAVPFLYCVEYDIHPHCEADCSAPRCQQLPDAERELGVPFWRGKCSAKANEARTELFGVGLGEKAAATSHDLVGNTVDHDETCIYENPGLCTPMPGKGGNYCTRQWSGVCFNCWIPGTSKGWPAIHMPHCPYDILQRGDYLGRFPKPACKSSLPRDLCCLYTGTCAGKALDASSAPLDEDGFALVASWLNTTAMSTFLRRVAAHHSMIIGSDDVESFAYACWARYPRKGASLKDTVEEMLSQGIATQFTTTQPSTSTATATSTTRTSITRTSIAATAISGADARRGSGSLMWALFGALAVSCIALAALLTVGKKRSWFRKPAEEAKVLPPATSHASDLEAAKVEAPKAPDACPTGRPACPMGPVLLGRSACPMGRGASGFDFQKGAFAASSDKPVDIAEAAAKMGADAGAPLQRLGVHTLACEDTEVHGVPPSFATHLMVAAKGSPPPSFATDVGASRRANGVLDEETNSSSSGTQELLPVAQERVMILGGGHGGDLAGGTEALCFIQVLPEQHGSAEDSGSPSSGSLVQQERPPPLSSTTGAYPPSAVGAEQVLMRITPRSEHSSVIGSCDATESTSTISGHAAFLPQDGSSEGDSAYSKETVGYTEV